MSEPASISASIADRYAIAVFDLAAEGNAVDALKNDVDLLDQTISESETLRDLLDSPLYMRAEQEAAISAVAQKLGLGETLGRALRLMAQKRRLFAVPALLANLHARIAEHNGIVTAEVTSSTALTAEQTAKLAAVLKEKAGKDVEVQTTVDESLIGGLVVKLGSKMIDTSIRSKLAALQNSMKEVG